MLRFFSDREGFGGDTPVLLAGLLLFLMIYSMWYFFWHLWDIRKKAKSKWYALVYLLIHFLFLTIKLKTGMDHNSPKLLFITRLLFSAALILTVQYALKSQQSISRLLLEKEQIQTDHYRMHLQALRSKVDPHFLFNTLNTLRVMVRNQHAEAEKFVMSLSDFYRQTLQYNENSTIELSKEIEVLEAYLFLMQSRNQAALTIDINIEETLSERLIPTLALQIITENCFKHNKMTVNQPLRIIIKSVDQQYMLIKNNVQPKLTSQKSLGHGLEYVRQRYRLLGIEDGLRVKENADIFEVQLKLI